MGGNKQICPNCGAEMHVQGFTFVCDFCGNSIVPDDVTLLKAPEESPVYIRMRYEYLKQYEQYIQSSKTVSLRTAGDTYSIVSYPAYYANDGNSHKILTFHLFLEYDNNKSEESLFLVVCTSKQVALPQLAILLDREYLITPVLDRVEDDKAFFTIRKKELMWICESDTISISSNLIDTRVGSYKEFIPYCCRFYNYAFDKRKYIYSTHQNLISDQNGK